MSKQYYAIRRDDNNQNSLKHYKYIKREKVNGKWRYYYDDGSKSMAERAKGYYQQAVKDRNMDALELRKTQRELKELSIQTAANANKQKLNELAIATNKARGLSIDGLKEMYDLTKESKALKNEEKELARDVEKVMKKLEKQKLKEAAHQETIAKAKEWLDTVEKSQSLVKSALTVANARKLLAKRFIPKATTSLKLKDGRITATFHD